MFLQRSVHLCAKKKKRERNKKILLNLSPLPLFFQGISFQTSQTFSVFKYEKKWSNEKRWHFLCRISEGFHSISVHISCFGFGTRVSINLIHTSTSASGFAFPLLLRVRCLLKGALSSITGALLHLAQERFGALFELEENFAAAPMFCF